MTNVLAASRIRRARRSRRRRNGPPSSAAAPRTAAAPQLSVDPIVTASQIVLALQTLRSRILPPLSANVITVGIIRGGERNNIIPAEVYLEGTIRTFDAAIQDTLEATHAGHLRRHDQGGPCDLRAVVRSSPPVDDRTTSRSPSAWSPSLQRVVGKENVWRDPAGDRLGRFLVLQQHRAGLLLQAWRGAGGEGRRAATIRRRSMPTTRRCRLAFER